MAGRRCGCITISGRPRNRGTTGALHHRIPLWRQGCASRACGSTQPRAWKPHKARWGGARRGRVDGVVSADGPREIDLGLAHEVVWQGDSGGDVETLSAAPARGSCLALFRDRRGCQSPAHSGSSTALGARRAGPQVASTPNSGMVPWKAITMIVSVDAFNYLRRMVNA
jgi:hypothetical protein